MMDTGHLETQHIGDSMANYTYTVIFMDAELAMGEGESFEFARDEALEQVSSAYPRDALEFVATCDSGVIRHFSGPVSL